MTRDILSALMLLRIVKEFFILLACVAAIPALATVSLMFTESVRSVGAFTLKETLATVTPVFKNFMKMFWLELLAFYAFVQAIRAHIWSRRSLFGRKWAHLYYAVLFGAVAWWGFAKFWDLFTFMVALGDIPREARQLFEIEGLHFVIALVSAFLAWRCLRVFRDPTRNGARH